MSVLKAITFRIVDAEDGAKILGPGLYKDGKRVGQIIAELCDGVTTYPYHSYFAAYDERTKEIQTKPEISAP